MKDVLLIDLPFRPQFKEPMLADIKLMTCRTRKKGKPGDRFKAFGALFELTHVFRIPLKYVATDCFVQEGVKSYQEFIEVWNGIHPSAGFQPEQIVWAHCFQQVQP